MWHRFSPGGMQPPFFARGAVKFVILEMLQEKPQHGYEIMKGIESRGDGFYTPSPGAIYPTLQMLEEMGYVVSHTAGNKKIYEITAEGKLYLAENKENMENVFPAPGEMPFANKLEPDVRDTLEELRNLAGTVVRGGRAPRRLRPEQYKEIQKVLKQARIDIEAVIKKT
jgi:DNA-binding PadR family transcriptional regulator